MARDTTLSAAARTDEDQLTQAILALTGKYGRYGYRRITVLLQSAGPADGRRTGTRSPTVRPQALADVLWLHGGGRAGRFPHPPLAGAGRTENRPAASELRPRQRASRTPSGGNTAGIAGK